MEDQSILAQKLMKRISLRNFVKLYSILYLLFLFTIYFLSIYYDLEFLLHSILFVFGYGVSTIVLLLVLISYGINLCKISQIPQNTTLYEVIMSPTIQYGPIKVIIPAIGEEETVEEIES